MHGDSGETEVGTTARRARVRAGVHAALVLAAALPVTARAESSASAASAPAPLADTALDGVTAVVADRATLVLDRPAVISLDDAAQRNAAAATLVNAADADVANATNVLAGAPPATADFAALQLNDVRQRERLTAGSLGYAERLGVRRTSYESVESAATERSSTFSRDEHRLRSREFRESLDQYSATVPEWNPLQDLSLTIGTPKLPDVTMPGFGFDFIGCVEDACFGIAGSIGDTVIRAPQLVLGTVSLDGDDIVLESGFVQLPGFDLGKISVTACFVACGSTSVDLGMFGGQRIDFPGDSLRLEGANPFKDVRLNANSGFALAGRGSIEVTPGRLTLGASLSLDLPDLTTSIGFDIPKIGELGPYSVRSGEFGIVIPPIEFEHTLVDVEIGSGFRGTFDGAFCLAFSGTDCAETSRRETVERSNVDLRVTTANASASSTTSHDEQGRIEIVGGASLRGAEAELIAMSEGNARVADTSDVQLAGSAQRGIAALHAVNAAGAMVGNAVNVGAAPAAASVTLGQTNHFIQLQTNYRRGK